MKVKNHLYFPGRQLKNLSLEKRGEVGRRFFFIYLFFLTEVRFIEELVVLLCWRKESRKIWDMRKWGSYREPAMFKCKEACLLSACLHVGLILNSVFVLRICWRPSEHGTEHMGWIWGWGAIFLLSCCEPYPNLPIWRAVTALALPMRACRWLRCDVRLEEQLLCRKTTYPLYILSCIRCYAL